jgi:hypothetical protein
LPCVLLSNSTPLLWLLCGLESCVWVLIFYPLKINAFTSVIRWHVYPHINIYMQARPVCLLASNRVQQ